MCTRRISSRVTRRCWCAHASNVGNISLFVTGEYLSNRLDATVTGFFLLAARHKSRYRPVVLPAKLYASCARNIRPEEIARDPPNKSLSYWPEINGLVNTIARMERQCVSAAALKVVFQSAANSRLSFSFSLSHTHSRSLLLLALSLPLSFFPPVN